MALCPGCASVYSGAVCLEHPIRHGRVCDTSPGSDRIPSMRQTVLGDNLLLYAPRTTDDSTGEQYGTHRCSHGLGAPPVVARVPTTIYPRCVGEISAGVSYAASHPDHGWCGHYRGHLRRALQSGNWLRVLQLALTFCSL